MHDVFISYKSSEYEVADRIRTRLEDEGIACWIAPDSIEGGQSYARQIPKAIRSTKVFVILISKQSMGSIWVARELDRAINENKLVMPFLLEDVPMTDEFRFYLTNVQQYPAYHDFSLELDRMITDIKTYFKRMGYPEPIQKPIRTEQQTAPVSAHAQEEGERTTPVRTQETDTIGNGKKDKNTRRRGIRIAAWIAGGIAAMIALILILTQLLQVSVGGKRYPVFQTFLTVENATLTDKDMKSIARMRSLKRIDLMNCTIQSSDLSALIRKDQYELRLPDCALDAEQIRTLDLIDSDIRHLDLSGNPIGSSDFVIEFPKDLQELNISDTGLDVSCLNGLDALQVLCIDGNEVKSLKFLSKAKDLKELSANRNLLRNLEGLESCIRLNKISVYDNKIETISGLKNAMRLEEADLSKNRISDITPLSGAANTLKKLFLSDNRIRLSDKSEWVSNWNFPELVELHLDRNEITYLTFLAEMPKLKILSVNGNAGVRTLPPEPLTLTSFSALECGLEGDVGTFFADSEASDIKLDLSDASITCIRFNSGRFSMLNLAKSELSQDGVAALADVSGKDIVIGYSDYLDPRILHDNWNRVYIVGCPLNKQIDLEEAFGNGKLFFVDDSEIPGLFG